MDKRLLTVVLDALLVAVVSAAIFYLVTEGQRSGRAEADERALSVAKSYLPIGAMITAEHVRSADFPVNAFPEGGFATLDGFGN